MAFTETICKQLSYEAGGYCSNPACRALTGQFVPRHFRATGEGAHIVAEKRDGPRGDSPLTDEQRAMASNGVWLCPTCHTKVDKTRPEDYSIACLQEWKVGAQVWWAENQGLPLEVAARPDERPKVPRPSAESLQGAKNFLDAHSRLFSELSRLRWNSPSAFERGIPIPEEVEHEIGRMSSRPKMGLHWRAEWSTRFRCDDRELLAHMLGLVRAVDKIERPFGSLFKGPRRISFERPDELAQAVANYLEAWQAFAECVRRYENFGI